MLDYNTILADASQLPVEVRVQLIEALWDTVPEDATPALSEEWLVEIQKRSAEYDAGKAECVPWEQIRDAAMQRAGLTR